MSNLLWYKQNGNWVNPTLLSKKNNKYEIFPIYYKNKGRWKLLEKDKVIELTTDKLLKIQSAEQYNDLIVKEFGSLSSNNLISNSNERSFTSSNYGPSYRFGVFKYPLNEFAVTYIDLSKCIFITEKSIIPKNIKISIFLDIGYLWVRNTFGMFLLDKDNNIIQLFRFHDLGYKNNNIDVLIETVKTETITANGIYTFDIPFDTSKFINKPYKLGMYNSFNYQGLTETGTSSLVSTPWYLNYLKINYL